MQRLLELTPERFAAQLRDRGAGRVWLAHDPDAGRFRASHPWLAELAEWLDADTHDARAHEAVFLEAGAGSGALLGAFVHKTVRGQAQGGLRHWAYPRIEDYLRDGLRLSLGMTRKNALAGLWWGGGKGLIGRDPADDGDAERRRTVYREYGGFISGLHGCYVTAEDAGTRPDDMAEVFRATRFTTCIPPQCGGSGNPSAITAEGVVLALEAALDFLGLGSLAGKRIAMQGTGHVGGAMIPMLLERGVAGIVASEISAARRTALLDAFAGDRLEVRLTPPGDDAILAEPCHALLPNALGGVLGPKTIPGIRARLVCGAANNQLADERRDAAALHERGVTFVPDFVANRMGIVQCANEQYGSLPDDPAVRRHLDRDWEGGIYRTTRRVLERARSEGITPVAAAIELADALAEEPHPLWGRRGQQIVRSLLRDP